MHPVADAMRAVCAAEALVLVAVCIYAAYHPMDWGQRIRFLSLACIGVVIVGAQIDGWGQTLTWRTPVLAVGLGMAVAGTIMHLMKGRRRDRPERIAGT